MRHLYLIPVVLLAVLACAGSQARAQGADTVSNAPTVDVATLQRQVAALQQQLAQFTAPQRADEERQALISRAQEARIKMAEVCKTADAHWSWMVANVSGTLTTFIGCVGK